MKRKDLVTGQFYAMRTGKDYVTGRDVARKVMALDTEMWKDRWAGGYGWHAPKGPRYIPATAAYGKAGIGIPVAVGRSSWINPAVLDEDTGRPYASPYVRQGWEEITQWEPVVATLGKILMTWDEWEAQETEYQAAKAAREDKTATEQQERAERAFRVLTALADAGIDVSDIEVAAWVRDGLKDIRMPMSVLHGISDAVSRERVG